MNGNWRRTALTLTVGMSALGLSAVMDASAQAPTNGPTQSGDEGGGYGVSEVIVTAQKRSQNLQEVPLSVTALTADALRERNIGDLAAVGALEPGLQVASNAQKTEITVRGIGASTVVGAFEQPVAVHVDGFYQARPFGIAPSFYDVERVEVLKGPQGTLYGRNATGGAVNIIYNRPTDEFSAELRAEGIFIDDNGTGHGWGYAVGGVVNGPVSDRIQARASLMRLDRDGYTTIIDENDNETDGQDADSIAARIGINFDLSERLSWYVTGSYFESDDRSGYIQVFGPSRPDVPLTGALLGGRNCGKCRISYSDYPIETRQTVWDHTSTLDYDLSNALSLKFLTQYREADFFEATDFDGVDLDLGNIVVPQDSRQLSQEIQLAGQFSRFNFILGAYYFDEEIQIDTVAPFPLFGPGQFVGLGGRIETSAYALFGETTYSFTDRLSLTLGARYSNETKGGANNVVNNLPAFGPAFVNAFSGPVPDIEFDAFTPKIGLNWTIADDVLAYLSYTKGFKSGGYNIGNAPGNTDGILADSFEPEEVEAYEAGLKSAWFERRLQFNAAIFFYKYSDLQLNSIVSNATIIQNSGEAEIAGLEIDVTAAPIENLELTLGGVFMSPEFVASDDLLTDPLYPERGPQSLEGNRLPRAPEVTVTLGARYDFHLSNGGELTPSVTGAYKSEQFFDVFNNPGIEEDGYWLLRSSLTYRSQNEQYSITLYGDNLTDELYYTGLFPGSLAFGYQLQGITGPGRTIGVRADMRF